MPKVLSKDLWNDGWASNLQTDENISVLSTQWLYTDNVDLYGGKKVPQKQAAPAKLVQKADGDKYE